jgi:carbon-monoxide dehydrogenase medium subunit
MIPAAFDYVRVASVKEAVAALTKHGEEAKVLAGGHSLLPLMKLRLANPSILIDIGRIKELNYIRQADGHIAIGALTTHYQVESSPLLREKVPMLPEAAAVIGDVQVRNRGTIGGSAAHGDSASDFPTALTALGAEFRVTGPKGERQIAVDEFFRDTFTTALAPDEILTEIRVPVPAAGTGQTYMKFSRRATDWAIIGVAALARAGKDGKAELVRLAFTSAGPTPMRAWGVEQALTGKKLEPEAIKAAAERAAEGLSPSADLGGSVEYTLHLARVFARRALEKIRPGQA